MRGPSLLPCLLAALTALVPGGSAANVASAPESVAGGLASSVLLSKGRVKVDVYWRNPYNGRTGRALALPQGDEFAYFTFSSEANPEVFVKVLGGNNPDYLQLFAAGLTTFEYTVTFSGCNQTKTFTKPAYAKITYEDGGAFPIKECQVLSDPLDPTHTVTVRRSSAGAVVYAAVSRDSSDRTVGTAFPYGRGRAGSAGVNEERMTVSGFKALLAKPAPGLPGAGNSSPYMLGWNDTVGPTPGQCYNFASVAPNIGSAQVQTSFSSQNTSTSFSGQTNTSATLSLGFLGFKASNSFSYSESSKNSTNAAAVYFNAYALYTLNSAITTGTSMLTDQGNDALTSGDNFSALCGLQYMMSVPAGMLATGRLAFSSNVSSTSSKISNSMKAGYGLEKLSDAMSVSHTSSDGAISLDFELQVEGGGAAAGQLITAIASPVDKYLGTCAKGTIADCDSFTSAVDGAVNSAVGSFTQSVSKATDFTALATFPNGVQGVTLTSRQVAPAYPGNDFLGKYATQMSQTLTLLNQVATLDNRAFLYLRPAVNAGSFNPAGLLDLNSYIIDDLHYNYWKARTTLFNDLSACLSASRSKTVDTDCAAVVNDSKFQSAYDYFGSTGPAGGDWMSQQNTIALQWAGNYIDNVQMEYYCCLGPLPMDWIYVDYLPPFAGTPGAPLANKSALVGFFDQPWGPFAYTGAHVEILPMANNVDLSKVYGQLSGSWWIYALGTPPPTPQFDSFMTPMQTQWTTSQGCAPRVDRPCTLGVRMINGAPNGYADLAITPLSTFFTP